MSRAYEKPASPTDWQAGGEHGGAGTWDRSEAKPTALPHTVRVLVRWHVDAARALLFGYALDTDCPEWGAVDAADWLDAAANALAQGAIAGSGP